MQRPEFPVRGSDTAHAFAWGVLVASSSDCSHPGRQSWSEGFRSRAGLLCRRVGLCCLRVGLPLFHVAAQAAHSHVLVPRMATVSAAKATARKHPAPGQDLPEQHRSADVLSKGVRVFAGRRTGSWPGDVCLRQRSPFRSHLAGCALRQRATVRRSTTPSCSVSRSGTSVLEAWQLS